MICARGFAVAEAAAASRVAVIPQVRAASPISSAALRAEGGACWTARHRHGDLP
jgi:hypothetical protein